MKGARWGRLWRGRPVELEVGVQVEMERGTEVAEISDGRCEGRATRGGGGRRGKERARRGEGKGQGDP